MRVVQWNVRRFSDAQGVSQVAAVAERLSRLQPSFVALNEVDLQARPEALEQLSSALGMHYAFFGHARGGVYGNALLARTPLDCPQRVELDGGTVVMHRGAEHRINRGLLSCETRWHGRPLRVAVTHLDHMSEPERIVQASSVIRSLGSFEEGPTLLLGDFNALTRHDYTDAEWTAHAEHNSAQGWAPPSDATRPGGSLSTLFHAGFRDTVAEVLTSADSSSADSSRQWASPPWTLVSSEPRYRIDFVLLRSGVSSFQNGAARSCENGMQRGNNDDHKIEASPVTAGTATVSEDKCWLEPRAAHVAMDPGCPSDHAPVVVDFSTSVTQ